MNCLILGGGGFLGSHIVDKLVSRGHVVRVFDQPNLSNTNLVNSLDKIEYFKGDFLNEHNLSEALDGMNVVVHLVSTTHPKSSNDNPVYDMETNVIGTINLLSLAHKYGIKKIIFASSGGTVYGIPDSLPISESHATQPICSYGISKLTIEKYLHLFDHLYGLKCVILRLANPYGERQNPFSGVGAISVFLWKVMKGESITIWGDGNVSRDYFYVGDLVDAFVLAIENEPVSKIYNIGGGSSHTINHILKVIEGITGLTPIVNYTPARKLDVPINYLDITRAKNELSWIPQISLEDGIERTWKWLKKYSNY